MSYEIVFGVPNQTLPLSGFPEGRIRLRLRNDSFAMAFVKTKTGIRQFVIIEQGGYWKPHPNGEQGRNERNLISSQRPK